MTSERTEEDTARLLEAVRAREQAATAGPWRSVVNLEYKTVTLQGGRPRLDLSVMQFERWGMNRAAPTFMIPGQRDGLQAWQRAEVYATPVPGREHHAHWFQRIGHPDAEFIEHAREDVRLLLEIIDGLTADRDRLQTQVKNARAAKHLYARRAEGWSA